LKQIAPVLLTTPGGAQALSELAPLLQRSALAASAKKSQQDRRGRVAGTQPQNTPVIPGIQATPAEKSAVPNIPEGMTAQEYKFRHPEVPSSAFSTFPQPSAGPEKEKEMNEADVEDYANILTENQEADGLIPDYAKNFEVAKQKQHAIQQNNQRIEDQKSKIEESREKATASVVARAKNSGLIKDPEDVTIAEKLALQAPYAANENERWEYVRTGLRHFESARQQIRREFDLPNPIQKAYRKLLGTYKDKETMIHGLQSAMDKYRKYGLYDELRTLLINELGLGSEDTELAIFPFTENQKESVDSLGKNTQKEPLDMSYMEQNFPGERHNLEPDDFNEFKERLSDIISKNEGINLIGLRGYLNQKMRYSWRDISKAMNQLIEEKRFGREGVPDVVQDSQLKVVNQAPLPGLAQAFNFLFTGAK